jgi:hypothetical protein
VFIHTEKGYFFIVNASKRYRLISERAVASWRPHRIVETTEAAVSKYRIAAKMKFRNGSLIHNLADGKIYLIVDGKRCQMVSPEALDRIGAKLSEAVTVSKDEINLHELGEEIT